MHIPGNTPIDGEAVRAALPADLASLSISVLPSVGSTNDWCRDQLREGRVAPFLCLAESQAAGKGRRGRQWLAAPAGDIILSYTRHFDAPLHALGCLAMTAGLAVKRCLQDAGIEQARLKWPNDVLVNAGKIAGVLIESVAIGVDDAVLVIGIGINIERKQVPGVEVACLRDHVDGDIDRNRIIASLLCHLEHYCVQLTRAPDSMRSELDRQFATREVVDVLLEDGTHVAGIMHGIDERGALRVRVGDKIRVFDSADVSLGRAGKQTC